MKKYLIIILIITLTGIWFGSCKNSNDQSEENKNTSEEVKSDSVSETEFSITNVPNVTNGAEAYFSPDSKSLIFNGQMDGDSAYQVYTINIDGTDLKKINGVGEDACSYFTPDGKNILFTSTKDNLHMHKGNYSDPQDYPQGAELYKCDLDGNNVVRLTNNEQYDAEISISPDGSLILFGRQTDGMMDLWTMNPDGSDQKQITFTPDWQEGGAFIMPDNETILFRAWKKSEEGQMKKDMHLFTVKTDGSEMKQLTNESGTHWAPYPAPDGKHVVYVKVFPPRNYEIMLRNLETGDEIRLTDDPGFDGFPAFSPDGKTVSFASSRGGKKGERKLKLWLIDVSSLNIEPIN